MIFHLAVGEHYQRPDGVLLQVTRLDPGRTWADVRVTHSDGRPGATRRQPLVDHHFPFPTRRLGLDPASTATAPVAVQVGVDGMATPDTSELLLRFTHPERRETSSREMGSTPPPPVVDPHAALDRLWGWAHGSTGTTAELTEALEVLTRSAAAVLDLQRTAAARTHLDAELRATLAAIEDTLPPLSWQRDDLRRALATWAGGWGPTP